MEWPSIDGSGAASGMPTPNPVPHSRVFTRTASFVHVDVRIGAADLCIACERIRRPAGADQDPQERPCPFRPTSRAIGRAGAAVGILGIAAALVVGSSLAATATSQPTPDQTGGAARNDGQDQTPHRAQGHRPRQGAQRHPAHRRRDGRQRDHDRPRLPVRCRRTPAGHRRPAADRPVHDVLALQGRRPARRQARLHAGLRRDRHGLVDGHEDLRQRHQRRHPRQGPEDAARAGEDPGPAHR